MNGIYYLNLPSGHEIELTEQQRELIKKALSVGRKTIMLNGNPISLSGISIVDEPRPRKGQWHCSYGNWHMDADTCGCYELRQKHDIEEIFTTNQLEAGNRCRGQYSIQNAINKIAMGQGSKWGKLIGNKKWRAEQYKQLLALPDRKWCDYKTGTCNCDAEFVASHPQYTTKAAKDA